MNSQQLFYINLIIGLLFVAYFIFGRPKQKPPTKLNLRATHNSIEAMKLSEQPMARPKPDSIIGQIAEPKQSLLEPESEAPKESANRGRQTTKDLSIFFMYNGHDWEAHEVLGIPQGASVEVATKAYQIELKKSHPSSYEFLESAHCAIFKKRRNQRL